MAVIGFPHGFLSKSFRRSQLRFAKISVFTIHYASPIISAFCHLIVLDVCFSTLNKVSAMTCFIKYTFPSSLFCKIPKWDIRTCCAQYLISSPFSTAKTLACYSSLNFGTMVCLLIKVKIK